MGKHLFIFLFIFGGLNTWAQNSVDEFELETETSFFEAHNAEKQLAESKDRLLKERLETKAAEERAGTVTQEAERTKKRVEKERIQIESQRTALSKERAKHKGVIDRKTAEIQKRNDQLAKDRETLERLAKEVRDLKSLNKQYSERINAQKRAANNVKKHIAEGERQRKVQKRALAHRQKVLQSLEDKRPSDLGRQPASADDGNPVNVTLHRQKRQK